MVVVLVAVVAAAPALNA